MPAAKVDETGMPMAAGRTTRRYRLDINADDASILVPPGVFWVAVRRNAKALKYEIAATARVVDATGSAIRDTGEELAIDDGTLSRPLQAVTPGEYINISHNDGSTTIGTLVLVCEGAETMPAAATGLTVTDPGV